MNDPIFGSYRVVRFLGKGAFGKVYYAEHVSKGTSAAVKVFELPPDKLKDFLIEARTVLLTHPNIVKLIDFNITKDDIPFIIMAYAPHGSLRQQHHYGISLPLSTIINYVKSIAAGLQYAHDE